MVTEDISVDMAATEKYRIQKVVQSTYDCGVGLCKGDVLSPASRLVGVVAHSAMSSQPLQSLTDQS